ncbi:MAG: hypothetical protein COV74_00225 [Candidatus Omnitrophica bacterium CG11_big_fil_rev_8_21_14_0_20_45_26]|uniref:Response regulatory domain-containing protein n=1 Tax=Candidatus Abzuiibacterium crystallinum TaxID=1974748 RepID=A0A2H0LSZ4_9BACT|nr:MAG: hypothetical protein COV74_00225 [Candidatus Omnitrophica bacterium CG11_big_fil_rev_8_21_14_0_20_45_26]PIW64635.1 MAG: hypothetical protein COW12_05550 [Candidatus Omnitrophica bacterium CG12_big_fil_rev_8_21_14_0_65_45_16]
MEGCMMEEKEYVKKEGAKKRVLLVDDVEEIRIAHAELLLPFFDVQVAETGERALQIFNSFKPDLVILDIELIGTSPALQGPDLLGLMKEALGDVVICMVSGRSDLKKKMILLGADAFFEKPVSRGELFDFLIGVGLLDTVNE